MTFDKKTQARRRRRQPRNKKHTVTPSLARQMVIKGIETKQLRYYWADAMDTNTATDRTSCTKYHIFDNVAGGDQVNEKTGRKVYAKGVKLDLAFTTDANTSDIWALRMAIVRLNTNDPLVYNDATAANNYANLYTNASWADAYPVTTRLGLAQEYNTNSFTVLHRRTYSLAGEAVATKAKYPGCLHISQYFPINRQQKYQFASATSQQPLMIIFNLINLDSHTDTNAINFAGYTTYFYKDF